MNENRELSLINIEQTGRIVADKPNNQIADHHYQRALKRAWRIVGIEMVIIAVQAVLIWLLEAGPIW